MRILIGNHIDDTLLWQKDQRAFTQRVFWFAKDHDIVVLSCPPDPTFLAHVAELTRVKPETLKVHVTPPGKHGAKLFDPNALLDDGFVRGCASDAKGVTEIFALWPSAQVAEFAERLGLMHAFPGASFFAQQGDELANNKGHFRAFASASGVPIAHGAVCRSQEHAALVMRRLLETGAVMVKQVHNGAGNGNEIVVLDAQVATGHAGSIRVHRLEGGMNGVQQYWEDRWKWATLAGRFPVVVEQFCPRARTIYAEFLATDAGIEHTATGTLGYAEGRLVEETIPLRGLNERTHAQLVHHGARLAETYRRFGYRGYMSADALTDDEGHLVFTEMNARIGASLHLYQVLGFQVVDVWRNPQRTVVQYATPNHWKIPSLDSFLQFTKSSMLHYDPVRRKGVMVAMPFAGEPNQGGFLFCIAYEHESEVREVMGALESRFG